MRANFDDSTRALKGSQGNTDYRFSLAKLKYYRVVSVVTGAIDDKLEGTGGAATRPSRATSKTQRGRKPCTRTPGGQRSTRTRGGKQ